MGNVIISDGSCWCAHFGANPKSISSGNPLKLDMCFKYAIGFDLIVLLNSPWEFNGVCNASAEL